jgi:hypothetical protein
MKACQKCGGEVEKSSYTLCRGCFYATHYLDLYGGKPPEKCKAIKADRQPCKAWAMQGRQYCKGHIHFELFAKVNA